MVSRRRTDDKIIYLILDICQDGPLKTNIIHQGKLNYTTVNRYLGLLVKNGMVTELGKKPTTMFKTTPKGVKFKKELVGLNSQIDTGWTGENSISSVKSGTKDD